MWRRIFNRIYHFLYIWPSTKLGWTAWKMWKNLPLPLHMARYEIRVDRLEDVEEILHEDIPLPLHMSRYMIRVDHLEDVEESLHEDIPLPLHTGMARYKIRVDRLEDVEESTTSSTYGQVRD
jgi:hypothetical protein